MASIAGVTFWSMATAACGIFGSSTPTLVIWLIVLVGGFFSALQFTSLNTLIYADIASPDVGRATGLGSVVQQVSLGLGVAVGGIVLQLSRALHGRTHIEPEDFLLAFLVAGLLSVGSIPLVRRLPPDAGDDMVHARKGA